jgi:hypothetical protein
LFFWAGSKSVAPPPSFECHLSRLSSFHIESSSSLGKFGFAFSCFERWIELALRPVQSLGWVVVCYCCPPLWVGVIYPFLLISKWCIHLMGSTCSLVACFRVCNSVSTAFWRMRRFQGGICSVVHVGGRWFVDEGEGSCLQS